MTYHPTGRHLSDTEDEVTVDLEADERQAVARKKGEKNPKLSLVSKAYDLDGDGKLDDAEQIMRDADSSGRGFLTNEEIYELVHNEIRAKRSAGYMKRLVVGLICFVGLLALANLGTSLAAGILAKDLKAEEAKYTGEEEDSSEDTLPAMKIKDTDEIAAAQSIAETFEVEEMSPEEIESRKLQVLEEMEDDPHSHAHRRNLKSCLNYDVMDRTPGSRPRNNGQMCSGKITWDNRRIPEEQFTALESKCKRQQNVYVKRKWGDGQRKNSRRDCVCGRNTSVVVKEKKVCRSGANCNKKNTNKNTMTSTVVEETTKKVVVRKNPNKKNNQGKKNQYVDREVIIQRDDGDTLHADCTDGICYVGGSILQGRLGDDCLLDADECVHGLVCELSKANQLSRRISRYGTCVQPTVTTTITRVDGYRSLEEDEGDMQKRRELQPAGILEQLAAGRSAADPDAVGTCARFVGLGQHCYSNYACGPSAVCDGLGMIPIIASRSNNVGDCTNSRRCASGYSCNPSNVPGSDRWWCEANPGYGIRTGSLYGIQAGYDGAGICVSNRGRSNGGNNVVVVGGNSMAEDFSTAIVFTLDGRTCGRFVDWRSAADAFDEIGIVVTHRTLESYLNRKWNGLKITYERGSWTRGDDYGLFYDYAPFNNWVARYGGVRSGDDLTIYGGDYGYGFVDDAVEFTLDGRVVCRFRDWRTAADAFNDDLGISVGYRDLERNLGGYWNELYVDYAPGAWNANDYGFFHGVRGFPDWIARYASAGYYLGSSKSGIGAGVCNDRNVQSFGLTWGTSCAAAQNSCQYPSSCCSNGSGQWRCCNGSDCQWAE